MRPGRTSGSSNMEETYEDQVKPDVLDFLFTLALTIGLAPELVRQEGGLLSRNWALRIPSLTFGVDLLTFLLGVTTLLFSWYGFNASIEKDPVLYGSFAGMIRFFLDAFLVVLYGFTLIKYKQLEFVTFLIWVIFILYVIWDVLKLVEYRKEPFDNDKYIFSLNKHFVKSFICKLCYDRKSLKYSVIFTFILTFEICTLCEFLNVWKDIVTVGLLIIFTLLYRLDKLDYQWRADKEIIAKVEDDDQMEQAS
jgi:hypothetical protein